MKVTLPQGAAPNTYYIYGQTPDNTTAYWYEFLFDGETGAEIAENVLTLNFVDGLRGNGDLNNTNGAIAMDPGGPAANSDMDGDGVTNTVEDAAQTRVTATTTESPTAPRAMSSRSPMPSTAATLPWSPPRRWSSTPRDTRHRCCS